MSERYCGFILIMPGKNRIGIAWQDRISIAQQTRISIAQHCLPKAGTSASWYISITRRVRVKIRGVRHEAAPASVVKPGEKRGLRG